MTNRVLKLQEFCDQKKTCVIFSDSKYPCQLLIKGQHSIKI